MRGRAPLEHQGAEAAARRASLTFGVDEAGRGPWLGPMTLAVVAVDPEGAATLEALGLRDSKRYGAGERARARRAELVARIEATARFAAVVSAQPAEIDRRVAHGELNGLERELATGLLERARAGEADRIVCDGARVFGPLRARFPGLVAVDRGESAHVAVAAASILAKHARDQAFAEIAARYAGDFGPLRGGGYVNAATREFVRRYRARHGEVPPELRRSWRVDEG